MRKATLMSVLILATIWGVPAPAQAQGFPYDCLLSGPCPRVCHWPGFFLSGTHLGLGPGYPGLFPAWSPFEPWGDYAGALWPPSRTPAVTVMILHVPRFGVATEARSSGSHRPEVGPAEGRVPGEMARGIESSFPVPELDTDLDRLSSTGGYSARLYYQGKFYSASETTNRRVLASGITVWQHTD